MLFYLPIINVSVLPHIFSRLDTSSKQIYKAKYKTIKKYGSASVIAGVGVTEATQLTKDIINSKLKVYGYKSFFAITLSPLIQCISVPFYLFTYGSRVRKFAIATTEIGAKILKGEMGIVNWAWIGADIILFGEPIPITDDSDFLMIHNKTVGKLAETIEEFGNGD